MSTPGDRISLWVCTWDPGHTAGRVQAQERAIEDGRVADALRRLGDQTALVAWMREQNLLSVITGPGGEPQCAVCEMAMERLVAPGRPTSKLAAIQAIAADPNGAFRITRMLRAGIDPDD